MMKQNLGKLDRVLRFALALWWLGPWAPQFSADWMNWAVMIVGWIALVESFTAWCGLHKICKIDNTNQ